MKKFLVVGVVSYLAILWAYTIAEEWEADPYSDLEYWTK